MLTVQKYTTNRVCPPVSSQTVNPDLLTPVFTDQRPKLTVEGFIAQHPDMWSFQTANYHYEPRELASRITEALKSTPVQYDNILDAIAFARVFVGGYDESTWVLSTSGLYENREITGLYSVNMKGLIDPFESPKEVYRTLLEADTSLAYLFSVTDAYAHDPVARFMTDEFSQRYAGLCEDWVNQIDVEVIDYVVLGPERNTSNHTSRMILYEDTDHEDGIMEYCDDIMYHYVDFGMTPDSTLQVGY